MNKKAYIYLRVSTFIQVEGKSLEGQLKEIEAYCTAYNIDILHVYSDEGKSGKSIQGRPAFQQLLKDVEEKEEVDYVIVWKLSRFGRNARETLNSLEFLQKHNCNLVAKEEHLDSSDKNGRFMITLLSAMAEMERENIIEQTNNGKKYNALSGGWNGGMAPYGYMLVDGKLVINEKEAEIVKKIFHVYLSDESIGYTGVTSYLNKHNIVPRQIKRLDRKAMQESNTNEKIYLPVTTCWYTTMVKKILDKPEYCGKLRYGHSKIETKNGKTKRLKGDNEILVDGNHEAIITVETYEMAQRKRQATGIKFNDRKDLFDSPRNILNQLARCPQCGRGMVACRNQYTKANGEIKVYYNYVCSYYNNHKHGDCNKNAIRADYIEGEVLSTVKEYLNRPNILREIEEHLAKQYDTSMIQYDIKQLQMELEAIEKNEEIQYNILSQIGMDGKYKNWNMDKIEKNINTILTAKAQMEIQIQEKKNELQAAENEKLNAESIKFIIEHFDHAFQNATKQQQRELLRSIIKEVKLGYDENGEKKKVIPKSIVLKFTGEQLEIVNNNLGLSGFEKAHVETVVLLSRLK